MKVFIVHAHAKPKSFDVVLSNNSRGYLTAKDHEVKISDLYAMGWNSSSDLNKNCSKSNPSRARICGALR